jgi:tetratricopeptide (TPR) repeat protein
LPRLQDKIIILAVIIFTICIREPSYGQVYFSETRYDTDSLKNILKSASGPERVRALCTLSWECRIDSAARSLDLAEEAYALAREIGDPELDLLAAFSLSQAYHHTGDYPKAVWYGFDARDMAEQQHDTALYYRIIHSIVFSYYYSGNYDLAIKHALIAFDYLAYKAPVMLFEKEIRLGWIYMVTGNHKNAIPHFLRAAAIADSTPEVPGPNKTLNYTHTANCYLRTGNYDSALVFINLCEKSCREYNLDFADYAMDNKGEYFYFTGKYDSAMACFREMADISRANGRIGNWLYCQVMLGRIFRFLGETDSAIAAYSEAAENGKWVVEKRSFYTDKQAALESWYDPAQSVPEYVEYRGLRTMEDAFRNLYEIYKSLPDEKNALKHLEALNEVTKRIRELDRKMEVSEINTRYETERKEQQILLLTSENELKNLKLSQSQYFIFGLAGFVLLIVMVALMLFRQNRMKTQQDKINLEQRLLRAQMNPHFLFNTLSNIQGYMLENDMDRASHYLSRFSRLMRNILDNTSQEFVPLDQEISTIENYLELQMVRYPGKFEYIIDVDEQIDPENTFIPPMLAQPFIENAIEHGIKYRKDHGRIDIKMSIGNCQNKKSATPLVVLEVTDNGVGREQSRQIERDLMKKHRPMATSITSERLTVLSRKAPRNIRRLVKLEIEDLYDVKGNAAGTRVKLGIPVARN